MTRKILAVAAVAVPFLRAAASDVVLPDGYTRLNYIESTFKQCIKTGIVPVWGDKIECEAKISNTHQSGFPTLFGVRDGENKNQYYLAFKTDGSQLFGFGSDNVQIFSSDSASFRDACGYLNGLDGGFKVRVTMQTNVVEWVRHDGTKHGRMAIDTDKTIETTRELYICGVNHMDEWVSNGANMRLYSFRVTSSDGSLKCDFIPCFQHDDSAVGLYDVVRKKFFANGSTTSYKPGDQGHMIGFTAGPAYGSMPLGFRKARYIQSKSNARQIIDTGYVHGTNDLVVMDYYAPKSWQVNGYCYLFGSRAKDDRAYDKVPENWYFYIEGYDGSGGDWITYNHQNSGSIKDPAVDVYDYACDPIHLECQASTATWVCAGKTNSLVSPATFSGWSEGKYPLHVFGGNFGGNFQQVNNVVMRLYSFRIYRDISGEMALVHDFIPCANGSGAAGLYDRVGDRFHGNAFPGGEEFDADLCDMKLPSDYTKVDYIESTSNLQYINTGYWHGTNDLVVMDYYAPKTWQVNGYCYLFGSRHVQSGGHSDAENWSFYIGGSSNQNRVNYNHQSSKGNDNPSLDVYDYTCDPIHLECQASTATWTFGGKTSSFTTDATFGNWIAGYHPLYIFTGNCGGKGYTGYGTVMRLYSFKIYRDIDGTMALVRDFVPCRSPSGAVGLYDLVCERFHGNANPDSGEDFVAAPPHGLVISVR